jgi:hypothetical protein
MRRAWWSQRLARGPYDEPWVANASAARRSLLEHGRASRARGGGRVARSGGGSRAGRVGVLALRALLPTPRQRLDRDSWQQQCGTWATGPRALRLATFRSSVRSPTRGSIQRETRQWQSRRVATRTAAIRSTHPWMTNCGAQQRSPCRASSLWQCRTRFQMRGDSGAWIAFGRRDRPESTKNGSSFETRRRRCSVASERASVHDQPLSQFDARVCQRLCRTKVLSVGWTPHSLPRHACSTVCWLGDRRARMLCLVPAQSSLLCGGSASAPTTSD